jgi:methyl-accepting chemotaxis protein
MMANEVNQLVSSITEQDIGTREIAKGAEEISQKSDKSLELITKLATLIKESNTTISNLSEIADRLESQVSSFRD